ncbi:MAG TPA: hypothetical protein VN778_02380 [Verrucomicrobiae bacterium]|nr:hypothetical protein [Verrucomicrobiae bacterium]
MNLLKKIATVMATVGFALAVTTASGAAAQPSCYQYNANGFPTSQTSVFNDICGAPGVGNESDFVRLRQSANGNDEDFQNNPQFNPGNITAACNDGDKFDVWNYVHNDAESQFNDNGSGTAVAHNVQSLMKADLGKTGTSFNFSDTVSASNAAATVSDHVTLNCNNGSQVTLNLVPGSVHLVSAAVANGAWQDMSDGTINSAVKLGSPTMGSGDQWGCWNYRIVIVYQVTVKKVIPTPPQVTATCDMFTVTASEDRKVTINQFKFTAVNANFKNVVVNWGDNHSDSFTNSVVGQTHQLPASPNQFEIMATANFVDVNGKSISSTNANCAQEVKFTPNQPPTITTPPTSTTTPPTQLVNTGAGSVLGLFAAASAAGATLYRRALSRKLSRQ